MSARQRMSGDRPEPEDDDAWRRAVILMGSSTSDELLDAALHPHRLLYRLFNEDGVRVFDPLALRMECRCSRQRVERVLRVDLSSARVVESPGLDGVDQRAIRPSATVGQGPQIVPIWLSGD